MLRNVANRIRACSWRGKGGDVMVGAELGKLDGGSVVISPCARC